VATLGTALTARHIKLLGRFAKRIVYLFDGDEAGMRAADRAAEFLDSTSTPEAGSARLDLLVSVIPDGMDPADFISARGAAEMKAIITGAQPLLRFVIDRRIDAHDLATPEGRSRALTDAAGVLASVRGSLLAQDYAAHVADRLRTDYATVDAAAREARPAFDGRGAREAGEEASPARPVVARSADPGQAGAENELARVLAVAPHLRGQVRDLLDIDGSFSDPGMETLIREIVGAGDASGAALFEAVSRRDGDTAQRLSAFLVDALEPSVAEARFSETLDRLMEFALKRELSRLQVEMRSKQSAGDTAGDDELFRKAADVQRRLAQLRATRQTGR
jgi:DNA primase